MRKNFSSKFSKVLIILLFPILLYANGFQINEQGAKALGMGGAFVAQANDPSAVYFNPAGITQLENMQISLGVSPIHPYATFKSDTTGKSTDAEDKTFYIPNFYATLKLSDKLATGLGVFSNFGLSTEWPDDWEGKYIVGGTNAEIVTLTINPNIAYKLTDKLSIAFGIDIQKMEITLENKIYTGAPIDASSKLKGYNWAMGWNAAIHYKITDNWNFGISYRSKIKHEIKDGTHDLYNLYNPLNGSYFDYQRTASADITLPDILYIGTSYKFGRFTFELDGQWTGWSSYDELKVEYEKDMLSTTFGDQIVKPKDWNDVWAIRFGVQYKVNKLLDLRAGIIRDFTPIPDETIDPLVPSGDRWLYALGFGLNFEKVTLDFAYNYLDDEGRDFNNEVGQPYNVIGKFTDVSAHIFGVNLTYKF
ncbi:transporter [Deferribacter autotrophicus]|uniref:Transporter n=1 Tax=Deferribacter autotrophicus TaxID=500465 RepID=A0A5A8F745_9BACT|nr:OmpP1/FadL family transporter [Deferribacter autotrophicus]KAA0259403.1 transporter [Deferribacter autotrophicus]